MTGAGNDAPPRRARAVSEAQEAVARAQWAAEKACATRAERLLRDLHPRRAQRRNLLREVAAAVKAVSPRLRGALVRWATDGLLASAGAEAERARRGECLDIWRQLRPLTNLDSPPAAHGSRGGNGPSIVFVRERGSDEATLVPRQEVQWILAREGAPAGMEVVPSRAAIEERLEELRREDAGLPPTQHRGPGGRAVDGACPEQREAAVISRGDYLQLKRVGERSKWYHFLAAQRGASPGALVREVSAPAAPPRSVEQEVDSVGAPVVLPLAALSGALVVRWGSGPSAAVRLPTRGSSDGAVPAWRGIAFRAPALDAKWGLRQLAEWSAEDRRRAAFEKDGEALEKQQQSARSARAREESDKLARRVKALLPRIPAPAAEGADARALWRRVGRAVSAALGDRGLETFQKWSAPHRDKAACAALWRACRPLTSLDRPEMVEARRSAVNIRRRLREMAEAPEKRREEGRRGRGPQEAAAREEAAALARALRPKVEAARDALRALESAASGRCASALDFFEPFGEGLRPLMVPGILVRARPSGAGAAEASTTSGEMDCAVRAGDWLHLAPAGGGAGRLRCTGAALLQASTGGADALRRVASAQEWLVAARVDALAGVLRVRRLAPEAERGASQARGGGAKARGRAGEGGVAVPIRRLWGAIVWRPPLEGRAPTPFFREGHGAEAVDVGARDGKGNAEGILFRLPHRDAKWALQQLEKEAKDAAERARLAEASARPRQVVRRSLASPREALPSTAQQLDAAHISLGAPLPPDGATHDAASRAFAKAALSSFRALRGDSGGTTVAWNAPGSAHAVPPAPNFRLRGVVEVRGLGSGEAYRGIYDGADPACALQGLRPCGAYEVRLRLPGHGLPPRRIEVHAPPRRPPQPRVSTWVKGVGTERHAVLQLRAGGGRAALAAKEWKAFGCSFVVRLRMSSGGRPGAPPAGAPAQGPAPREEVEEAVERGDAAPGAWRVVWSGRALRCEVRGLQTGATYELQCAAVNGAGEQGPFSDAASVTPPKRIPGPSAAAAAATAPAAAALPARPRPPPAPSSRGREGDARRRRGRAAVEKRGEGSGRETAAEAAVPPPPPLSSEALLGVFQGFLKQLSGADAQLLYPRAAPVRYYVQEFEGDSEESDSEESDSWESDTEESSTEESRSWESDSEESGSEESKDPSAPRGRLCGPRHSREAPRLARRSIPVVAKGESRRKSAKAASAAASGGGAPPRCGRRILAGTSKGRILIRGRGAG